MLEKTLKGFITGMLVACGVCMIIMLLAMKSNYLYAASIQACYPSKVITIFKKNRNTFALCSNNNIKKLYVNNR